MDTPPCGREYPRTKKNTAYEVPHPRAMIDRRRPANLRHQIVPTVPSPPTRHRSSGATSNHPYHTEYTPSRLWDLNLTPTTATPRLRGPKFRSRRAVRAVGNRECTRRCSMCPEPRNSSSHFCSCRGTIASFGLAGWVMGRLDRWFSSWFDCSQVPATLVDWALDSQASLKRRSIPRAASGGGTKSCR